MESCEASPPCFDSAGRGTGTNAPMHPAPYMRFLHSGFKRAASSALDIPAVRGRDTPSFDS
jgi:hypothetical protein